MTPERAREPKVWEFEGDWYYLDAQGASHCANTKESAAILAAVKPLEEEIGRLTKKLTACATVCGRGYTDDLDIPMAFCELNEYLIAQAKREEECE